MFNYKKMMDVTNLFHGGEKRCQKRTFLFAGDKIGGRLKKPKKFYNFKLKTCSRVVNVGNAAGKHTMH